MIVPDANLLIYAYDKGSGPHAEARRWWEKTLSGPEPVGVPNVVILAFIRLMTHPTLSGNPLATDEATQFVQSWLAQSHCRVLPSSATTVALFFDLLKQSGVGGNLTTDTWIAASALEYGGRVYSNDRDFDRFPSLTWVNPLE